MVCFLVLNCVILLLNGGLFYQMLTNEILMAQVPSWNGETVFVCGWASSLGMFTVSFVLYLIVFCADAGYTQSIAVDKFFVHLDKAIKEERNLDYFCFFCRTSSEPSAPYSFMTPRSSVNLLFSTVSVGIVGGGMCRFNLLPSVMTAWCNSVIKVANGRRRF